MSFAGDSPSSRHLALRKFDTMMLYGDPVLLPEHQHRPDALYGEPGARVDHFFVPPMREEARMEAIRMSQLRVSAVSAI